MRRSLVCFLLVLAVATVHAQVDVVKMANDLKIQGVRKMEVICTNDVYYAAVDVEFSNASAQGVKFHDGTVTVLFDVEGGIIEKVSPSWKEKTEATIRSGDKDTKVEVKTYDRELRKSEMVEMGKIKLGESVVPEEVASFQDRVNSAVELKGTTEGGQPRVTRQTLYVLVGNKGDDRTVDKIKDITNIMGDPGKSAVMRLKISSKTALFLRGKDELDDGMTRTITLNMTPSLPRDYLFK
jgi:hypothetical protein